MQDIIDTYEIIGKIDDQKSISSNSLPSHEESLVAGAQDANLDNTDGKESSYNEGGRIMESTPNEEEDEQASKGKGFEGYKIECLKGDTDKSQRCKMENVKGDFEEEKKVDNVKGGSENNLVNMHNAVGENRKNDKIEGTSNGGATHGGNPNTENNTNRNPNQEKTTQIDNWKNSCKKHYKVLIHAPACWKGEKFNSTPFIFVYDKSSNFFTYSESPLEIEKYIIDTSAEDFESRVLTIIFYDSVFACTTSSLLLNNNKGDIQNFPKPLSVFYLPLSKLDLCNDSVKYRLALRTNSILCDVNIKEAISLFNNNSKIAGPNVNKFSLHFILKNRNYCNNEPYSYLNYQTKFYGLPRSNLSSCVQKYTGPSIDRASSNVGNRYLTKSSKSQVHTFTKHQADPNQFISLERLKNKWENYNQVNNEKRAPNYSVYNPLRKKDTKLTSYDIPNDNESFVSRVKSEVARQEAAMAAKRLAGNDTRKYGEANKEKGNTINRSNPNRKETYNTSGEINSYHYGKTKSMYDIMHVSREKLSADFDAKDDVFPEDSASMINIFEKGSVLSERGNEAAEGGSTLTSNLRVAKDMYSRVKSVMRKRGNTSGQSGDNYRGRLDGKVEERNREEPRRERDLECSRKNQVDPFEEDRSACYSQVDNLRYLNANNSVCSSYGRNDENVILAMKEIKEWMEKIEDKMSTISCDKSDLNGVVGNKEPTDTKYNKIVAFLMKSVKNNIKLKNKCIYRSCYLNIRNLYLLKKNEKVKFENKLLMRNYGNLKSKYKNVLVNLCKKNLLIKYYSIKDKFQYSKKYENMMRHLQQEKNDLLSIIEEKKYQEENNHNINMMLSEELKKAQEDKESILSEKFFYKSETDKSATKCKLLEKELERLKEELECAKRESEKARTGTGQIKLETEQLKMEREQLKMEREQLKMDKEQLKIETEQLRMETEERRLEKDALIKELGDTKAKYFNLTGILEGEEKMYSQKVKELEKKIENLTEEKNTLINEIKNEIDNFTKMLNDKEIENAQMKEKLKELRNVEEKYKDTQINFDSLKKEFERSFDEVQIILKEMIQKEKEYTKKYNNSIKSLETEHKKVVEKLLNEKEQSMKETNYYKDVCLSQCNRMTTFDESLTAAEKLLNHVLSQYPQLFNEFKVTSRNNVLNKSFGKMHYENIQSVRDNIKLIRKSLSQFKISFKNSSFNFQMGSDYNRKYSTHKKASLSSITGNKRMNSIMRYYENYHKYANHVEQTPYCEDESSYAEQSGRRRSISNNSARNMSIISNNSKSNNLKIKIDSYNAQLQRNVSQSRCRSGSVSGKENVSSLYGDLKKKPPSGKDAQDEESTIGGKEHGNLDDQLAERDSSRYTKSKRGEEGEDTQKGGYLSPGKTYDDGMEWHVDSRNSIRGGVNGMNHVISPNDMDELNHIDIVNMYEESGYFKEGEATNGCPQGASNIPSGAASNPAGTNVEDNFGKIHPTKTEGEKKTIEKENYEFDKNNFKEIISFIEKNVIKNSDTLNTSEKDRKNVENLKGVSGKASLGENSRGGGESMCKKQEQPDGHFKAEDKNRSGMKAQGDQKNSYQSADSRKIGMSNYRDKVSRPISDDIVKSVSNNSKANNGQGSISNSKSDNQIGLPNGLQRNRTNKSNNTTSVTKVVVGSARKNSSMIYGKGIESGTVDNNNEDAEKRQINTNYKYKVVDDSIKHLRKDNTDVLKYAKGSIVRKSVTSDKERNTSSNMNKSALSRT
ncbi:conserved Plasmodium protein, unknown function [Plasmodium knowlesi strain H]|uniref:Uncharacterized protein n=3 Tax=Plasmodium knowlesi TaxID=5850 RepID=A0A5K1US61_PLAKH|nr:conserved Plasmodium protein, unknown function [Plasmodium knowlesi strain H]OTN66876.1 Uncharacterized protein PKNOH_S08486700 [Plasmodium knowlesi]CAA9986860.1 conserved Plasmodium protein, unknown function [Plasmodium knowlesi strain H]SBO23707.1 conserved Plasmodium protein, unknown function [Plasmodium knowlesi strain H]SBO25346.1 conserved Plasmodium protein, unknown function [Plasmodium knowlesi strain H]VVS76334.1 conserved Plasmodium protein, unknown function [Plasmodium knowlesi s|eukprot:XP_002260656.1 hypothetical protein, conserved in Plasmodium species [Plasmodium knowlesi strain H]